MQRGEGRGVGNGLDRENVDIVDDDRATRMQTDNHNGHGNHETTITHSIGCCSGTQSVNHNHKMDHGLEASARDRAMAFRCQQGRPCWMPGITQ